MFNKMYNQKIVSNEDYIYHNAIKRDILWEEKICIIIADLLEEGTDMIDLGAHIGLIPLGVKRLIVSKHKYHCFEPSNEMFSMLKKNTENHDDINLYNIAISDKIELCNMSFNPYNNGASFINKIYNEHFHLKINGDTMDKQRDEKNVFMACFPLDLIIDYNIFKNRISVIKIDIEGFEYKAILGMKKFLKKHKPAIIIEIFERNYELVKDLLETLGYYLKEEIGFQDYLFQYSFR